MVIPDLQTWIQSDSFPEYRSLRAALAGVIRVNDGIWGVVLLGRTASRHKFTDKDVDVLDYTISLAAANIEKEQLVQELERSRQAEKTLSQRNHFLQHILDSSTTRIWHFDKEVRVIS